MKGSDIVKMTIDIGGELITLDVKFDDQNNVRDTERAIKISIERLKKAWPDNSDRNILAMTAYQFAKSYHQMLKTQEEVIEIANKKIQQIDNLSIPESSDSTEAELNF